MHCFRGGYTFLSFVCSLKRRNSLYNRRIRRGKTSLLNAIMGFVPLRKGRIKVGDILLEPATIDIIRRHIAWIPQELALPSEWVKEMIALPFALKPTDISLFWGKTLHLFWWIRSGQGLIPETGRRNIRWTTPTHYDSSGSYAGKAFDYCRRTDICIGFRFYR